MDFNVKHWLEIYKSVKLYGRILKHCRHSFDKKLELWFDPLSPFPEDYQKVIEKSLEDLLMKNSLYLDACGLIPKEPKWVFNIDETKTWASHRDFIYTHLI
jgi:hypothetical protein